MGNGASITEKIRLGNGGWPRMVSALWPVVLVAASAYATWCVQSYRMDRVEQDVRVVQSALPHIQQTLVEIQADLRWIRRGMDER